MTKPIIKENSFSVDDIHKIREYHYETTKDLWVDEWLKELKEKANKARKELEMKKAKKTAVQHNIKRFKNIKIIDILF